MGAARRARRGELGRIGLLHTRQVLRKDQLSKRVLYSYKRSELFGLKTHCECEIPGENAARRGMNPEINSQFEATEKYTGVFDTAMSSKFALDLQALPL